jgi:Tfp pilus assembly protein PilP
MKNIVRLSGFVSGLMLATVATAQQPAAKPQPGAKPSQPAATTPAAAQQQPEPAPAYSYEAKGRRDPFVSLLARGTEGKPTGSRPAGLPGLMIGEVTVKGIVRDRTGFIAMIQGSDNSKTFIVRSGEKLMDGTVKAITADSVVFSQDVNDPLSMVKQKEVRKTVRPADGGRG